MEQSIPITVTGKAQVGTRVSYERINLVTGQVQTEELDILNAGLELDEGLLREAELRLSWPQDPSWGRPNVVRRELLITFPPFIDTGDLLPLPPPQIEILDSGSHVFAQWTDARGRWRLVITQGKIGGMDYPHVQQITVGLRQAVGCFYAPELCYQAPEFDHDLPPDMYLAAHTAWVILLLGHETTERLVQALQPLAEEQEA